MHFTKFLSSLACPETLTPLSYDEAENQLRAQSGRTYRIHQNVPLLLTPEDEALFSSILNSSGKAMVQEYEAAAKPAVAASSAAPAPPQPFPPLHLPQHLIDQFYDVGGENTQILSVGGGPTRNSPKEINLNMGPFAEVDVVGNACRLPFATGSIDGVWCNAVLEHVAGAPKAVEEIIRTTKPGGGIMLLVPFMQPLHGYPDDYQRYTAEGLAHLLSGTDILAKGQAVGPSYALHEILTRYLNGPGMTTLPRWMRGFCRRVLLPKLRQSSVAGTDVFSSEEQALSSLVYCFARKRG